MHVQRPAGWVGAAWGAMILLASLPSSPGTLAAVTILCVILNFVLMGMPGMLLAYMSIPLLKAAYGRRALERLGGQNFVALGVGAGFLWPAMILPVQLFLARRLPGAPLPVRMLACAACLSAWCVALPALLYPFSPKARR